jgi:hypothetical protein
MHFKAASTDGEGEFDPVVKGNETVSDVPTGLVNSLEKTIVEEKKLKLKEKNELNGAEDVPIETGKKEEILKLEKTVKREGNYPTG